MKKLFTLCTAMMLVTAFTFAQQGQIALGVNSQIDNVSWQDYHLVPTVGYFLSDNMMVGTGFYMSTESSGDEMTTDNNYPDPFDNMHYVAATLNTKSAMSLTPFVRYYLNERLYASAGIGLNTYREFDDHSNMHVYWNANGNETVADYTNTTEYKESTFGFHAGVGYSLMYNDYICFEPAFVISSVGGSSTTTTEQTTQMLDSNGAPVTGSWYTHTEETKQDAPGTFTMAIRLGINIRLGE